MWENLNSSGILIAVIIILVTLFLLVKTRKGSKGLSDVTLLMGPSGSGKTSLFYSWALKGTKDIKTVTSQSINRGMFLDKCDTEVIDCPGHPRLKIMGLKFVPRAKNIVYLIDGNDPESIRSAGEQIYDILIAKGLRASTRMLLCKNKTDAQKCVSTERMLELINSEIEKLRTSRAQELEGDNAVDHYIGEEGEPFDILTHAPIDVQVASSSVKKRQTSEIESFLHSVPLGK